MKASSSACNGEMLAIVFLALIKPSKPSRVLYHPCPEKISWTFHDPSVKPHRLGIKGNEQQKSVVKTFLVKYMFEKVIVFFA